MYNKIFEEFTENFRGLILEFEHIKNEKENFNKYAKIIEINNIYKKDM